MPKPDEAARDAFRALNGDLRPTLDDVIGQRRRLGFSDRHAPYADCICVGCRSPGGWNRCARDAPPYSTMAEHQAAWAKHVAAMQPEADRFNAAFGTRGVL